MIKSKQTTITISLAVVISLCAFVKYFANQANQPVDTDMVELEFEYNQPVSARELNASKSSKSTVPRFVDGTIQLVSGTETTADVSAGSANRIQSMADFLKTAQSGDIPAETNEQVKEALLQQKQNEDLRKQKLSQIKQVIKRSADSGDAIDLPAVCMSDGQGWPAPIFQPAPTGQQAARIPPQHGSAGFQQDGLQRPAAQNIAKLENLPPTSDSRELDIKQLYREVIKEAGVGSAGNQFALPSQNKSANLRLDEETIQNYNPHAQASAVSATLKKGIDPSQFKGKDPHADVYKDTPFPSATACKKCHEQIFDEWSTSSHAYAAISPMFHKFEQKLNDLAQGTVGYFCLRCHAPVATTMKHRRDRPIWDGPRVYREGVTCVACHRVKESYGKVNGERRMEKGGVNEPVYGTSTGMGVEQVIKYKGNYKVKVDPKDKGIGELIHRRAIQFEELSKSTFCVSCHQVAVQPGIKLEVVWDQYRASPAYREGTSCQDCHMGKVPGVNEGYSVGPAAIVNGLAVQAERKHANHTFYGPGYSIAHPGIFPQNPAADRWTINQWLNFDWRAGWGTKEFEERLADGKFACQFPPEWANVDDRYDARDVVTANQKKLAYKKDLRRQVMENGSKVNGPFFDRPAQAGRALKFRYQVCNTNRGHNMPSGSLGAQPQLWLNVVLIGPSGQRLWESGHLDSYGDLADIHSLDVLNNKMPLDRQLFNLQTKFLITNIKGTDREVPLPVNWDVDQLPFIRPGGQPISNINHPPFIRMEGHSIPPLGSRDAVYRVPGNLITEPGTYRLSVRLRSRAEPLYFMRFVESTNEMMRTMNERMVDAHPYTVTFEVK